MLPTRVRMCVSFLVALLLASLLPLAHADLSQDVSWSALIAGVNGATATSSSTSMTVPFDQLSLDLDGGGITIHSLNITFVIADGASIVADAQFPQFGNLIQFDMSDDQTVVVPVTFTVTAEDTSVQQQYTLQVATALNTYNGWYIDISSNLHTCASYAGSVSSLDGVSARSVYVDPCLRNSAAVESLVLLTFQIPEGASLIQMNDDGTETTVTNDSGGGGEVVMTVSESAHFHTLAATDPDAALAGNNALALPSRSMRLMALPASETAQYHNQQQLGVTTHFPTAPFVNTSLTFRVVAQDGTSSESFSIVFFVNPYTGNSWSSVSSPDSPSLLAGNANGTLTFLHEIAGQVVTLTFPLDTHAQVVPLPGQTGVSAATTVAADGTTTMSSVSLTAPAVGVSTPFLFSVVAEDGSSSPVWAITLSSLSGSTAWIATIVGATQSASSSDATPTISVPYSKAGQTLTVQLTLADGATVPSTPITIVAPSTGVLTSDAVTFTVTSQDGGVVQDYSLRVHVNGNPDSSWKVAISSGTYSTTVLSTQASTLQAVSLPSPIRGQVVVINFTLPDGATLKLGASKTALATTSARSVSITAPAGPSAAAILQGFGVVAQDGSSAAISSFVQLSFTVAASTQTQWSAVAATVGSLATVTLLSTASPLQLSLEAAAAGQTGSLTVSLPAYASLQSSSISFTAPAFGASSSVSFTIIAESGARQTYTVPVVVATGSDVYWTLQASANNGATVRFITAVSDVSARSISLPAAARGLPITLALTIPSGATIAPVAQSVSLVAPASAIAAASVYSFTVTLSSGSVQQVSISFSVAAYTSSSIKLITAVPTVSFVSTTLTASSTTTPLRIALPASAAQQATNVNVTLPTAAMFTDNLSAIRFYTAPAAGTNATHTIGVSSESGVAATYSVLLVVSAGDVTYTAVVVTVDLQFNSSADVPVDINAQMCNATAQALNYNSNQLNCTSTSSTGASRRLLVDGTTVHMGIQITPSNSRDPTAAGAASALLRQLQCPNDASREACAASEGGADGVGNIFTSSSFGALLAQAAVASSAKSSLSSSIIVTPLQPASGVKASSSGLSGAPLIVAIVVPVVVGVLAIVGASVWLVQRRRAASASKAGAQSTQESLYAASGTEMVAQGQMVKGEQAKYVFKLGEGDGAAAPMSDPMSPRAASATVLSPFVSLRSFDSNAMSPTYDYRSVGSPMLDQRGIDGNSSVATSPALVDPRRIDVIMEGAGEDASSPPVHTRTFATAMATSNLLSPRSPHQDE